MKFFALAAMLLVATFSEGAIAVKIGTEMTVETDKFTTKGFEDSKIAKELQAYVKPQLKEYHLTRKNFLNSVCKGEWKDICKKFIKSHVKKYVKAKNMGDLAEDISKHLEKM